MTPETLYVNDHNCLMPSACGVTGFYCSNAPAAGVPRTAAGRALLDAVRQATLDPAMAKLLSGEGKPELVALVSVALLEQDILAIEAEAALQDDECPTCHGPLASHVMPERAEAAAQPALDTATLRARLREAYIEHPDDSHGQGYINHGIRSALHIVGELAGDIDWYAACEPEGDPRQIGERNWCKTHIAPMGHRWSCDLAEAPWVWHDARLAGGEG